ESDAVTDTVVRLRQLGGPHARARAGAVLLASAGVAFAIAAAGLALAPRVAAVVVAWLLIAGSAAAAVWLVRRAGRPTAPAAVGRGDGVTVTLDVPAATRALLWTRGPGEPWRPAPIVLDSVGHAARRIGPLESDLYLRATSGSRRSDERRVSVALPAFVAGLD